MVADDEKKDIAELFVKVHSKFFAADCTEKTVMNQKTKKKEVSQEFTHNEFKADIEGFLSQLDLWSQKLENDDNIMHNVFSKS